MTQGRTKTGIVVISAKVKIEIRNKLDQIQENLNLSNRSEVIKLALESYLDSK